MALMKKSLMIISCFICLNSCSYQIPDKDYITAHSLSQRVEYNKSYFYITEIDTFSKAMNSPGYMIYVGSIDDYHLFYKRYKVLPIDGVQTFALPYELCVIPNPKSPMEEDKTRTPNSFRRAKIENGKCILIQVN